MVDVSKARPDIRNMTDAEKFAWQEFRYGGRGAPTHKPALGPDPHRGDYRSCHAVDPVSGRLCGRWLNFVQTNEQYYAGEQGSVRHNPRPYGRAGHTRRRGLGSARCHSGT